MSTATDLLRADATVDLPLQGRADGPGVEPVLEDTMAWLVENEAVLEPVRDTYGDGRTVSEWVVHLRRPSQEPIELPVAVVGDEQEGRIRFVRVYHSLWPLRGRHESRPEVVAAEGAVEDRMPEVVARYQRALRRGDLEGVLDTFASDACAREPSGSEHRYEGKDELRRFYSGLFTGGGIGLRHKTLTDDGVAVAIEYDVVEWGGRSMEPAPGVAVYERNSQGLLTAARIYDDADQPG